MEGFSINEKQGQRLSETDVYEIINRVPPAPMHDEGKAPFSDFSDNTDKVWKYVSQKKTDEYLRSRLFFDSIRTLNSEPKTLLSEINKESNEVPVKIPLDLVVGAAGFSDWGGRGKGEEKSWSLKKYGSGKMESSDVIKLYAGSPSQLPPVSSMNMYIQLDKKVFFDNGSGDSHRIAAAILRGDKEIETRHLRVYQLDKNYL